MAELEKAKLDFSGGESGSETDEFDDGRTVADMSMIERPTLAGLWFGRRFQRNGVRRGERMPRKYRKEDMSETKTASRTENIPEGEFASPSAGDSALTPEDRRAYLHGVIRASLLIGLIYVIVFAAAIAFLVWVLP